MGFWTSLRDTLLVTRAQLARAIRTRNMIVLCLAYVLLCCGNAYMFTRGIHQMEKIAAKALSVPETKRPGSMLDVLRERGQACKTRKSSSFWYELETVPGSARFTMAIRRSQGYLVLA